MSEGERRVIGRANRVICHWSFDICQFPFEATQFFVINLAEVRTETR